MLAAMFWAKSQKGKKHRTGQSVCVRGEMKREREREGVKREGEIHVCVTKVTEGQSKSQVGGMSA